ncbi:MAG TPA: pirin family protein [Alphaproteobacteria bacterium]|nr:pirin family protein [Alphaproteobacteria bacterium]
MISIRKSDDRGKTQLSWLDSKHSFSFANYFDLDHIGFGTLRVINEDKVDPAAGFDTHPHSNMEILTYVLEGELSHKDTLGTGSIIIPGDIQRMSAGSGISHSESNPLSDAPVHLLQIWIIPEKEGLPPSYEQKNFIERRKPGKLTLLASHDGHDDSLTIHQDVSLYVLDLDPGQSFTYNLEEGRLAWVQMARGKVDLNGNILEQGDGAAINNEKTLEFLAENKAEILIFDLTK